MDYPETIGIVADTHCGSEWGLRPPSRWDGHTPEAVKWLWNCWMWIIENWPPLDLLIFNGDMIEGKAYRDRGVGCVTVSLEKQVKFAIEAHEPLVAKARKTIRTIGTLYHECADGPLQALDEHFKITTPLDPLRQYVRDIQLADGAVLNIKHEPEGSAALYLGTVLDRELIWAALMEHEKGLPVASHLIRSHLHTAQSIEGFGKQLKLTPCFCLQTPYAIKRRRYRWIPSIGAILMRRDPLGFKGYLVTTKTFPLPVLEVETYGQL